jgi:post-segregation antitoxin (ccd killing protein)
MVTYDMNEGKVSTCLYVSREVLANAKRLGLNVSRISENALVEAIGRLQGPETRNGPAAASGRLVRGVGFGPTNPSGMGSLITKN